MVHVPVTLLYGSLVALLLCSLGMNVSFARVRSKIGVTDTPGEATLLLIRAHGNGAEWAPMLVLLLLMLELSGVSAMQLHVLGGGIFFARALHGAGVLMKSPLSVAGAALTYLLMVVMPLYGLVIHFRG